MTQTDFDVCVIGAGPAGLGFAQAWARRNAGGRLLVLDAGPMVGDRFCTVQDLRGCRRADPCHVLAGVGGASGLAGGKLSEYPAGRGLSILVGDRVEHELKQSMNHLEKHLSIQRAAGGNARLELETQRYRDLSFELRHYPANKYAQADLTSAWSSIVREVISAGGTVLTGTRATSIQSRTGGLSVATLRGTEERVFSTRTVVLATGRSGGDLVTEYGVGHQQHALDVGVRIEFPAASWPDLDAVHNDLKLHFGDARTFCTSKSGWISPYKYGDIMLLEGRTDSAIRSPWSNLAITIRTESPVEDVVAGMRTALLAQGPGSSLRQPLSDYLAGRATHRDTQREPGASFSYWRWGDINALFPETLAQRLRDAVRAFSANVLPPAAAEEAHVFGPEIDYYWKTIPHRTTTPGIWAAGDVTGAYRGILQAYTAGRYLVSEVQDYILTAFSESGPLVEEVEL